MFDDSEFPESWGWMGSIDTPDATVDFGPYRKRSTGERCGPEYVVAKMQEWAISRNHNVNVSVFLGDPKATPPAEGIY